MGGISEHVYSLTRQLGRRGHEVEILTSRIPGSFPRDVKTIRMGRGVAFPINKSFSRMTVGLGIANRVNRLLRSRRYDVIHIHGSLAPVLPMLALRYSCCLEGTKAVATFHAGHGPSMLYRIFKNPMSRNYFTSYDGLIAVSPVAEDTMAHFFPGNYRIIPNGVDTGVFSPGPSALSSKLPKSSLKLLFLGRFEPKKGLRHLLCAMPEIKRRVKDVKLVVVGGGPMKPYYDRFISNEIKDAIFFAGEVVGADRAAYYRWCDISVTPSIGAESFGITLLEAMGCGKPVVATDIPAFRYVMGDREGVFVRPCDAEDIARGVLELVECRSQWPAIGKAGRRKAVSYSWSKIARMVEDYFYEVKDRCGSRN
ncbi:glycosyltransferase family 4 protein [candidate division WOR-3 bacterium]|nr:glycosyltransferase family 4 protein [candidate division WOR-3 bacterium]